MEVAVAPDVLLEILIELEFDDTEIEPFFEELGALVVDGGVEDVRDSFLTFFFFSASIFSINCTDFGSSGSFKYFWISGSPIVLSISVGSSLGLIVRSKRRNCTWK